MNAAANNASEAGIRKAAILVASLDEFAADLLLEQLGPERAQLVRQAVTALAEIDAEEQQRVIDEFRRIGPMLPGQCPPGIELDGLSRESYGFEKPPHCNGGAFEGGRDSLDAAADGAQPFGFLCGTEEANLAQLLGNERPQTIALVLSHLPAERAGAVLARFAAALQVEVVRRLVDLENTDPETLGEIQRALETRLSQQFAVERGPMAGPKAVARILAASDRQAAGNILDNLATYDRPLAEQLGCRPLEFDDLVELDDAALLAAFRAAEPEVAQAALLGAPPELLQRMLRLMAPEEAESMCHSLDHPGPIRLSDVDDARRQMAALAQRMTGNKPTKTVMAA